MGRDGVGWNGMGRQRLLTDWGGRKPTPQIENPACEGAGCLQAANCYMSIALWRLPSFSPNAASVTRETTCHSPTTVSPTNAPES